MLLNLTRNRRQHKPAAVAAPQTLQEFTHTRTQMSNGFLKYPYFFPFIPLVGSRNPDADLRLNSQASSINSSDTDERAAPKSAARACAPYPVLVWTWLLIRKKNTVLESHSPDSLLHHLYCEVQCS